MLELTDAIGAMDVRIGDRTLVLRELTGQQRDSWEAALVKFVDGQPVIQRDNIKASLVHKCLFNGDGKLAYASADEVGALPARTVDALYEAARELSGMDADAEEAAGNA